MPGGLVALLDDISIIARTATASIDDIGIAASKAGTKAAGVVIDDAAVTPSYVTGLSPARELPIIWKITKGSLKNKLLFLLPAALLLSEFLPWLITPILMLGGAYLCYEGAEKVIEKLGGAKHGKTVEDVIEDPAEFERLRIAGAVRTDFILSAEIMAIALSQIDLASVWQRGMALAAVAIVITVLVYGAVALIVKMDDVGLHLAKKASAAAQTIGKLLLVAMPKLLVALSFIGTIAMLWVGGGIILHGLKEMGVPGPEHMVEIVQHAVEAASGVLGGILGWLTFAGLSAMFGLAVGGIIAFVLHKLFKLGHETGAH